MIDPRLAVYDYDLPEDRIAVHPLKNRSDSNLMVLEERSEIHSSIDQITRFLKPNDLLVLNNTKVLQARVLGNRSTGGNVELLFLQDQPDADGWLRGLVKPSRKLRSGEPISIQGLDGVSVEMGVHAGGGEWTLRPSIPIQAIMSEVGNVPIPPYLRRANERSDQERYQTVFAQNSGAVAAPTAGLHFTNELLGTLQMSGVTIEYITLHVGIGTFRNVRSEDLDRKALHKEWYDLPKATITAIQRCKERGGRVIAVGTTVTRCLETAFRNQVGSDNPPKTRDILPSSGYTDIFIQEGFSFHIVDGLLTNFHLPKSSLLMLVSAFAGRKRILDAYQQAINHNYRFFSYGDAMLILP